MRRIPEAKDGKWPFHPNVEDVRELQRLHGQMDVHFVWIGPTIFVMAHTDEERANLSCLEDCKLHQDFAKLSAPPAPLGYYRVTPHVPDAYSESYRGDAIPWDFDPVEVPDGPD